jgi:GNAT superfamily N-acetyltransferase
MQVREVPDATTFLEVAGPVLHADPAANNLALGIAQQVHDHPGSYEEASFWIVERAGQVVGAALRTAPYPVVVVDPLHDGVTDALVEELAERRPDLPGVTANEPWASRFADAWAGSTGASWRISIGQGVYALTSVRPHDPAPGSARAATPADRDLLTRWMQAFEREALQAMIRDEHATARAIAARLGPDPTGGFDLWEVDGDPVSLSGWTRIPGGARIGPVYTPPDHRGRGYASNLVADVSLRLLSQGAEACFLYTDLGNPTSNAIYRRLGYEQVAESSMIVFDDAG